MNFAEHFKNVCSLSQQHSCFTLVEVAPHMDSDPGLMGNSVLLIRDASPLHYLRVEHCQRLLLPGYAYTFNHRQEHELIYNSIYGATNRSKPLSALKISFHRGCRTQIVDG